MDAAAIKALQDRNEKLTADNAALTARIAAIEAERQAEKAATLAAAKAAREVSVKALFADTGRQYTPEAAAVYLNPETLPEAAFAQLAADMRSLAKVPSGGALFAHVATGEPAPAGGKSPGDIMVAQMAAMTGAKS